MVGVIRNSLSYIVASPFMALRQLFDDKMRNHGQFLAEGERPYCIFSCSVSLYQACCRMYSDKDSTRASRPEVPSSLRKYCTSSAKRTTYPFVRDLVILPAAAVGEENIAGGRYTRPEGRHFSASCWNLQNSCKRTCFPRYAFPSISGDLLRLLHGCCTTTKPNKPAKTSIQQSTTMPRPRGPKNKEQRKYRVTRERESRERPDARMARVVHTHRRYAATTAFTRMAF
jgi:hypothetical protein